MTATGLCRLPRCGGLHYGLGWCQKHYHRVRRHGSPDVVLPGHRYRPVDAATRLTRFSARVGECLVYQRGAPQRSGHRNITYCGRTVGVHRVAYEMAFGPIPAGLVVMHTCDNPPCIEPGHLRTGSIADNNRDRDAKGRHRSLPGSKNGYSRLQEWQVARLKAELAAGASTYALAAQYGVHQSQVWRIKAGHAWKHVRPEAVLAAMGAHHLSWPLWPVPAAQAAVLDNITWPDVPAPVTA